jgi:hypothetical protein
MITPGTYKARAREWALGMSQNGKEQIAVLFDLVGGPHDGQSITWFGYFTDAAVDRTLDSLRHCGWSSDNLAELDGLDQNEVEIVVDEEFYEGKTRTKVKWVNRPSRLALKEQLSPQAAQAFAARLRGRTVAHKQKYGAQPAAPSANHAFQRREPPQASFAHGQDDSDIPF